MKCFLRALYGFAALTVAAASAHGADDWVDLATVSMTNATTPKLTSRYVCYTDGADIACNAPSLYVTTGGLVGIGNTDPSTSLDVSGVIKAGGGSGGLRFVDRTGGQNWEWYGTGAVARLYNGGSDVLAITNSGNVGIGTSTPNAKLDVYGAISATNFVGNGSGLTGVVAASGDRIVSGTNNATSLVAISNTGYISLTQSGVNTGWFSPQTGFVTIGVSSTGGISGTTGYFSGGDVVIGSGSIHDYGVGQLGIGPNSSFGGTWPSAVCKGYHALCWEPASASTIFTSIDTRRTSSKLRATRRTGLRICL